MDSDAPTGVAHHFLRLKRDVTVTIICSVLHPQLLNEEKFIVSGLSRRDISLAALDEHRSIKRHVILSMTDFVSVLAYLKVKRRQVPISRLSLPLYTKHKDRH